MLNLRYTPVIAFALISGSAFAAPAKTTAPSNAAKPATAAKPAVTPARPLIAAAKPKAVKPGTRAAPVHAASAARKGRMVTTRTSTGKTITYNCSLAGNATKTACK